jgi:hypothetical protein
MAEHFGDGSKTLRSNLLLVGERLVKAGDLLAWGSDKVRVVVDGHRVKAVSLLSSARKPVIVRVRSQMVAGMRVVFAISNGRNYKFLALAESEDLENWVWRLGEVIDGETTVIAEKEMIPVTGESMLLLSLDMANNHLNVALDRKLLFRTDLSTEIAGGLALIPPKTREDVDIILSKVTH